MAEKRLFWLKLKEDFFSEKAMKKLRKMAGGDTYTIIYLKLLLLGLKNQGRLFYDGIEDSFPEELALEIDEEPENVQFCLIFLEKTGFVEKVSETELFLTKTPEMTYSESPSAARMRKSRAAKASQCDASVTQLLHSSDKSVTLDIDKDIDTDKDKEIDSKQSKIALENFDEISPAEPREKNDYQTVVDDYNRTCTRLPRCIKLSDARKKAIAARLKNYTPEELHTAFEMANASDFLCGNNKRNWSAGFDWIISDRNIIKILEGNYNEGRNRNGSPANAEHSIWDSGTV